MTRGPVVLTVVAAAVAAAACRGGAPAPPPPDAAEDRAPVTGILRVAGADPLTQLLLEPDSGAAIALVGPLRAELDQAVGLRVWVVGRPVDPVPPAVRAVEVERYEVVALDTLPARAGSLERDGGVAWLVAAAGRWELVNAPAELAAAHGARVWVAGAIVDGRLPVVAFGILRRDPHP